MFQSDDYSFGYDHGFDNGSTSEQTKIIKHIEKLHSQYSPDEWKERAILRNLIVSLQKGDHEKQ